MSRNGLGFNNLLYAAVEIQYFKNRIEDGNMGQVLTIEEPEAHLHPHAQKNLITTLASQPFQVILSSHSPDLCAVIGVQKIIALSRGENGTSGSNLAAAGRLDVQDIADLNRYLDANRGALFFARKTILVEGPAEVYLVTAFARCIGADLSAEGISVISINGTHFEPFLKIFETGLLSQKCAVIRDGDAHTKHGTVHALYDDGGCVTNLRNEHVATFFNKTTLEYAVLNRHTAPAIKTVAASLNARKVTRLLTLIEQGAQEDTYASAQLHLLRLAIRSGKARFAQALAPEIERLGAEAVPAYIRAALDWVR
jgi:putative ATP-dependent endonuclease of OLD family